MYLFVKLLNCTHAEYNTCESSPSVKSIRKKSIDQTGDTGNLVTTSGYTMKAKPAP